MKKFTVGALKALGFSSPLWLSFVIIMFAFSQTFGVGVVIMLGLVAVQLILSKNFSDLAWAEFRNFNFSYKRESGAKKLNIIFNLTRVGTIISTLTFLSKGGIEMNPFGGLGIAIAIVTGVIGSLLFFFIFDFKNYEYVRGFLAISVLVLLITFSYLSFGTQLIWIPAILSLAFSSSKGFWELDDKQYDLFAIITPILLGVVCVTSTVIQFWKEISSFVVNVLTLELLYIPIWLYLLVPAVIFIMIKTAKASGNKSIKRRAFLAEKKNQEKLKEEKLQEEKEKKEAEEKRAKDLVANNDKSISAEDIIFVASRLSPNSVFSLAQAATILKNADLFQAFVTVSDVKQQIFYPPVLISVLGGYNSLFNQVRDDATLVSLISVISVFNEKVTQVTPYKGSADLLVAIFVNLKNFPQSQKKEEK